MTPIKPGLSVIPVGSDSTSPGGDIMRASLVVILALVATACSSTKTDVASPPTVPVAAVPAPVAPAPVAPPPAPVTPAPVPVAELPNPWLSHSKAEKAGAFGFYEGMTLEQAKAVAEFTETGVFEYTTTKPPSPVAPFMTYRLFLAPKAGLCMVIGETNIVPYENLVKPAKAIIQALKDRYGDNEGWKGPDSKRTAHWMNPQGSGTGVMLTIIHPNGDTRGQIVVVYSFGNDVQCLTEANDRARFKVDPKGL